ncbi:lysophospholipid acyltransferase family protein [bacterium]|nr:lysophospholipid acyltransferase family protein [bacterium]
MTQDKKKMTFRKLWKKFWQPILRMPLIQWVIAIPMAVAIWLVYFTCIKKIDGYEIFRKYRKKPAIFVFWHGRSMMLSPMICMGGMRGYAIASRHQDGRMMAKLQRLFGLKSIYGSTSEGSISVLRQGVRVLRDGRYNLCLSPDGPSGPSMRVKDGALYFAKMTGAPIIPACYSCNRAWFQNRWDRYLVALPFSKITCKIGEPIFIDPKATPAEFEAARKSLEDLMVRQVRDLDGAFGLYQVEQDQKAGEFKQAKRDARAARRNARRAARHKK